MPEIDFTNREQYLRKIEEILEEYRDFVLRNKGSNLHSEEEKDQELKRNADEILQLFCSQYFT